VCGRCNAKETKVFDRSKTPFAKTFICKKCANTQTIYVPCVKCNSPVETLKELDLDAL
jgi:hypothetical protein